VINNLIRNAFQHTQQGMVKINQQGSEVIITNVEIDQDDVNNIHEELGFGLGMQLVEKLTSQFGWHYAITQDSKGYQVSISFS
jgi:two-component sensor histidine kinase